MTNQPVPCVFCQIIDESLPSSQVYRDDHCIAFLDLHPVNPGHTLVCPIRHVTSFTELKPEESAAILHVVQRIALTQKAKLPNCAGVNVVLSDGAVAGQEVPHTHFHVIPRHEDDGFGWRRFGSESTIDELDSIAALLGGL